MKIIYPHNQKMMLKRAHDVLVMNTCHALANIGTSVHLIIGKTSKNKQLILDHYGLTDYSNLYIHQIPILRGRISWHGIYNFFCLMRLFNIKINEKPDLIYLSERKLCHFLLKYKKKIQIPIIYEVHELHAPNYQKPDLMESAIFTCVDAIITTTDALKEAISNIYSPSIDCFIVPLATKTGFQNNNVFNPTKRTFFRLFYIGQLYPLQGVEIAIEALSLLPSNITLDIIGGNDHHISALKNIAIRLNVISKVKFHGFVKPDQVFKIAQQADAFLIPSLPEGKMPYVSHTKIYEYLSFGRPIVASDLPSIKEVIKDQITCLLFRPGDPKSLAETIFKIYQNDNLAKTLSLNALNESKNYTWELRAKKLINCFTQIISTKKI